MGRGVCEVAGASLGDLVEEPSASGATEGSDCLLAAGDGRAASAHARFAGQGGTEPPAPRL